MEAVEFPSQTRFSPTWSVGPSLLATSTSCEKGKQGIMLCNKARVFLFVTLVSVDVLSFIFAIYILLFCRMSR